MNICICVATDIEIHQEIMNEIIKSSEHNIDLCVTGMGSVQTTFRLSTCLWNMDTDLVINAGICGSFSNKYNTGCVVQVVEDNFADLGFEDNEKFVPFKSEFLGMSKLINKPVALTNIPSIRGITVNTVTGSDATAKRWVELFQPDIETTESAAVFYTCSQLNIPLVCFRAVSNSIGNRDKNSWNIPLAVNNVWLTVKDFIHKL